MSKKRRQNGWYIEAIKAYDRLHEQKLSAAYEAALPAKTIKIKLPDPIAGDQHEIDENRHLRSGIE
jgi:hypothetical protein